MPNLIKDFAYNVQAMLHWWHLYSELGEWTANKNCNTHRERVEELLPKVLQWIKDDNSIDRCG